MTEKCKHCGNTYELGKTGTVDGCDECLGIVRNPVDGTIVFDFNKDFENVFVDELTDMEKA